MAKVTPPQNVPSELLDGYRATLGEKRPDDGVRKRYPYRVPTMQSEVGRPSPKQKTQRARFDLAVSRFNDTPQPDRQRWYDAMPPWGSFLWYYDYFILSALMYDSNLTQGGVGVIKTIQLVKEEVPTTGEKAFAINEVDPAKTVVMLYGNSYISDTVQRGTNTVNDGATVNCALSPNVDPVISEVRLQGQAGAMSISEGTGDGDWGAPFVTSLAAALLVVGLPSSGEYSSCQFSYEVIERLAQTIYPVIVSIAAEVVTIDWAKVPSVAADVSIIVIEYI